MRSTTLVAHVGGNGDLKREKPLVIPRAIVTLVTGRTATKVSAIQDKKRRVETALLEYSSKKLRSDD